MNPDWTKQDNTHLFDAAAARRESQRLVEEIPARLCASSSIRSGRGAPVGAIRKLYSATELAAIRADDLTSQLVRNPV